jgi:shikimate kinase
MAGAGKSYWANRLAEHGFKSFSCDELIAKKLAPLLSRPDGTPMGMGEWMGFPFQAGYSTRESRYLGFEKKVLGEILGYLEDHKNNFEENIVVDTTGSVIYTGKGMLRKLRQYTIIVHLSTPPEVQEQLLRAYVSHPHPMLWRGVFNKRPYETKDEALARCYPKLFLARQVLYERYADVTIDYYTRMKEGFGASEFLEAAAVKKTVTC